MGHSFQTGIKDTDHRDKKIKGATDDTLIGNVGDALKVTSIPGAPAIHFNKYLLSGTSREMAVNTGTFSQVVPAGETWHITAIHFYLNDGKVREQARFGDLLALANGVLTQFIIGGTTYDHSLLQDNRDIGMNFRSQIQSTGEPSSLAHNTPSIFASHEFTPPITLNAGDSIQTLIQDNLSTLTGMSMSISAWRSI